MDPAGRPLSPNSVTTSITPKQKTQSGKASVAGHAHQVKEIQLNSLANIPQRDLSDRAFSIVDPAERGPVPVGLRFEPGASVPKPHSDLAVQPLSSELQLQRKLIAEFYLLQLKENYQSCYFLPLEDLCEVVLLELFVSSQGYNNIPG